MEDSFINPNKWPIKPLNGMNISNPREEEIMGKKAVKAGIRLVIRKGATEEEWEFPLSDPKVEEINHCRWHNRKARR